MTIGEADVDVEESRCANKGVIGSFGTGSARSKLGVASGEVESSANVVVGVDGGGVVEDDMLGIEMIEVSQV